MGNFVVRRAVMAGLLWLVGCVDCWALQPMVDQPEEIASLTVEELLQSLTFGDFQLREAVFQELRQRDWDAASELTRLAYDPSSSVRLRARYMLRRTFWDLAPKVAAQLSAENAEHRESSIATFRDMVGYYPLEEHHHGGRQKEAIVLQKLGYYSLALEAYLQWEPPGAGCGTCEGEIRGEKVIGLVDCLRRLNQLDRSAALCWEQLRDTRSLVPVTQFAVALVEIYDTQGRLDELADELEQLGLDSAGVDIALEYLEIRRDFRAGRYTEVLPHLTGGNVSRIQYDITSRRSSDWRGVAVAELFGQMGETAVPVLADHLEELNPYNAGWTIYALQLTGDADIVAPILAYAKRNGISPIIAQTLRSFPDESTAELVPLLNDRRQAHKAIAQLADVGTEAAVEALIAHLDGAQVRGDLYRPAYARRCMASLWRLTGETLGVEGWSDERLLQGGLEESKGRWQQWWARRPDDFQVKGHAWWRTPEAAPHLIEALNSPNEYISRIPFADLLAMEHPILAQYLREESKPAGQLWMRFDPQAAIPALIPHARYPGFQIQSLLGSISHHEENRDAILACLDCRDPASWFRWWEEHKDVLNLEPMERWW